VTDHAGAFVCRGDGMARLTSVTAASIDENEALSDRLNRVG
jgi:hypothetical protein